MLLLVLLFLSGLLGGILTGLLGIGGGIVYVLILPYIFLETGISQDFIVQFTIANSLFGIFFASLAANITNIHYRDFYLKESLWVGLSGSVSAIIVIKTIVNQPFYSPVIFNGILVILFIYMLVAAVRKFQKKSGLDNAAPQSSSLLAIAGSSGGILSAMTGGGGGVVIVPILTVKLKMDIKKAKSISLAMILLTSLGVSVTNLLEPFPQQTLPYQVGFIYLPVAIPLVVGVLVGSPLGVRISRLLSSKTISIIFGTFMLILIVDKTIQFIEAIMK